MKDEQKPRYIYYNLIIYCYKYNAYFYYYATIDEKWTLEALAAMVTLCQAYPR